MTRLPQQELIRALRFVRTCVCGYLGNRCDCKYGASGSGEETGCPEIRQAIALVEAMTPAEYDGALDRLVSPTHGNR